jgi:hypothetical protein
MAKAPWLETLLRWTGQPGAMTVPTTQSTLEAMDAAGVEVALKQLRRSGILCRLPATSRD